MAEVTELIQRTVQGMTSPWIAMLDDGQLYYIKGQQALCRGLVIELICAELGVLLNLPVPPYKVAYLDPSLLKYNEEAFKDFNGEICEVFASSKAKEYQEIQYSQIDKVSEIEAKLLFFFDYLIMNEDRTLGPLGGNQNLLFNSQTNEIAVIDHNLGFDINFDFERHKEHHIFSSLWYCPQRNLHLIPELQAKLPGVIKKLRSYVEDIPEEWLENQPNLIEEIFNKLELYKEESFWEGLQ